MKTGSGHARWFLMLFFMVLSAGIQPKAALMRYWLSD